MTTATMLATVVVITLSLAFQGRCVPHHQDDSPGHKGQFWDLTIANWWYTFDKRGSSTCKEQYLMKGLLRNTCNYLHCIEGALCERNRNNHVTGPTLKANWWRCLNKKHGGWCKCRDGSYLTGFYRTGVSRYLHNLEEGYCKRVNGQTRWHHCYYQNVRLSFDKKGLSHCEKDGYFMVGLWKSRNCDRIYCIETFKCCAPK